jgi:hypothetical protein
LERLQEGLPPHNSSSRQGMELHRSCCGQVEAPTVARDNNLMINGVDTCEQRRAGITCARYVQSNNNACLWPACLPACLRFLLLTYTLMCTTMRRNYKWWHALLDFSIDIAMINAIIVCQSITGDKRTRACNLVRQTANALCTTASTTTTTTTHVTAGRPRTHPLPPVTADFGIECHTFCFLCALLRESGMHTRQLRCRGGCGRKTLRMCPRHQCACCANCFPKHVAGEF